MIKKLIFGMMVMTLLILPCFSQQDADKEVARTTEFTAAVLKAPGAEKINALKAYIQKFPETSSKWTVLAYYNLTVEYFNTKDYSQAVQTGEKTLKMSLGEGETARIYLVIANSYGVKSAPIFNQEKALDFAQKTITYAESKGLEDVLAEARKLKGQLTPQPAKQLPPDQQIKFLFSNADYSGVIAFYQKLSGGDKTNEEIHKTYATALLKSNKWDQALAEFQTLYSKSRKAAYVSKIAEIYEQRGKSNKAMIDNAIDAYLEAHLLYSKEGSSSNAKIALDTARYQLYEKYGLNDKIKKVNATLGNQQDSSKKNAAEISRLEIELRKEERRLRKEYESQDIEPPDYEKTKLDKLRDKIAKLKSGAPASGSKLSDEAKKLDEEINKVKKELDDLLAKARKRLGM